MAKKDKANRDKVILVAYDRDGNVVDGLTTDHEEYYESSLGLVGNGACCASKGIRRLTRRLYDLDGRLSQTFETHYSEAEDVPKIVEFVRGAPITYATACLLPTFSIVASSTCICL